MSEYYCGGCIEKCYCPERINNRDVSESTETAGYVKEVNKVVDYLEQQYTCGDNPMGSDCWEDGYSPEDRIRKATAMLKKIVER